jgi:hypothetical protein
MSHNSSFLDVAPDRPNFNAAPPAVGVTLFGRARLSPTNAAASAGIAENIGSNDTGCYQLCRQFDQIMSNINWTRSVA